MSEKSTINELGYRISKALDALGGKVSDLRRDAVEMHLATVASNLEAEVADRGSAVKEAQALAVDAKKRADEAQKLADEAKAAAAGAAKKEDPKK
jgi:hypothetical protein